MVKLLLAIDDIFPTTSCNHAGQDAMINWSDAGNFLKEFENLSYVPSVTSNSLKDSELIEKKPSTIIRIKNHSTVADYELIRDGAVANKWIRDLCQED